MSAQGFSLFTQSVVATAAITGQTFITGAGTTAAAGGRALGVAKYGGAIGASIPTDVIGSAYVTSGAAIAVDALIEVDASGRAITRSAGTPVARALQAASGAGQTIEVVLIVN